MAMYRSAPPISNRGGFTLMELLATIAIIAIVSAVVTPLASGWLRNQKLQEAIDDLRTDWIKARTHAMDEGRQYRFQVLPGNQGYRIAPNEIGQWQDQGNGVNAPPSGDPDEVAGTVMEKTLPDNLAFEASGDVVNLGGNPEATWLFLPDGRAKLLDADGREHQLSSIILSEQNGGRKRQLTMRALTAQASLTPLSQP